MHRSRSHLVLLVSSLSLIFTLGVASVVPATGNSGRQRQTRRHRVGNPRAPHLIREIDPRTAAGSPQLDRVHGSSWSAAGETRGTATGAAAAVSPVHVAPALDAVLLTVAAPGNSPVVRHREPSRGRAPPVSFA
jgi:hypothetical protein